MRTTPKNAVVLTLIALLATGACALQSAVYGLPVPTVHDEFSYLLAADTFARGRCTNPTPPLWQHFETMHVLMRPTYASKYPPGQGLFLAAGKLLGHPVFGVWLGIALACAAGAWMLRAFVPRRWALAGGLIMATRLGLSKWGWVYWGGGVAFAAGALFIGGWMRVLRKPRPAPAVTMTFGLVLLAISRPLEGLLLCVPVGVATVLRLAGRGSSQLRPVLRQALVPALAVLLPAALAMGYYNYRVTGSAARLPYLEYAAQYDIAPVLLVQTPSPPPLYRHKEISDYQWQYQYYSYDVQRKDPSVWRSFSLVKVRMWQHLFLGWSLTLPLVVLPCVLLKSPRTRFALIACGFVLGFVATVHVTGQEHYVAPAAPLLYVLVVQCLRYVSLWHWRGVRVGRPLAAVWLVGCLLAPVPSLIPQFKNWLPDPGTTSASDSRLPEWMLVELRSWLIHMPRAEWAVHREQLEHKLKAQGGRHLVLVRYDPDHSYLDEWVFNEADIPAASVIWARPMGREGYERLARQFPDRSIWQLQVSAHGSGLSLLRGPVKS
jgi:hypothetical protein